MSLGKRGSGVQRDNSSCTLIKFNKKTNHRAIEGEQNIVGTVKAERIHKR